MLGFNPATLIHTDGDTLEVDWVVSHFQPQPVENATLKWRIVAGTQSLASGEITGVNVAPGEVPVVGRSSITIPSVAKAVQATLEVELDAAQSGNSWDLWIFPKFQPRPDAGDGMAASPLAFDLLAARYPGIAKLGTPQAATATLVVAANLQEPGVPEALEQGKSVVCLSLPGYDLLQPGTSWACGLPMASATRRARPSRPIRRLAISRMAVSSTRVGSAW